MSEPDESVLIEFDPEQIRKLSVEILRFLESNSITVGEGLATLALTCGRLAATPAILSIEQEDKFMLAFMDFIDTYSASGGTVH